MLEFLLQLEKFHIYFDNNINENYSIKCNSNIHSDWLTKSIAKMSGVIIHTNINVQSGVECSAK